jgi:hypothetical protein
MRRDQRRRTLRTMIAISIVLVAFCASDRADAQKRKCSWVGPGGRAIYVCR